MVRAKILDLRNNLSRYLKRVQAGEEVVVCHRNADIAVIKPILPEGRRVVPRRKLGWMKGRGTIIGDLVSPVVAPDEWEAAHG